MIAGLFCFLMLSVTLYCSVRLYLLKQALREAAGQMAEIRQNLRENQLLHLPLPDRDLEQLMAAVNALLEAVRDERSHDARREREFQAQIQAVSHDLCTPLTVILGYLKLLQQTLPDSQLPDEVRETLPLLTRKAQAMELLTSQFYDYSRFSTEAFTLPLTAIDAGRILRETFTENCLILETARLHVTTELSLGPVWAVGNQKGLERILVNLLQNAGRYAGTSLHIAIRQEGRQVKITFENDTDKITKEDIPSLFRPFYMNDRSRGQGVTGLGLTIARSLAEKMGGTLEAEQITEGPAPEQGIRVRFILCLAAVSDPGRSTPSITQPIQGSPAE